MPETHRDKIVKYFVRINTPHIARSYKEIAEGTGIQESCVTTILNRMRRSGQVLRHKSVTNKQWYWQQGDLHGTY